MNYFVYILLLFKSRIFNRKFAGLILFIGFSLFIFLKPLKKISKMLGYGISPWGIPFLFSNVFFGFMFLATIVYFFSNVFYANQEYMYHYIRLGKNKWGIIQMLQIILCSGIIVLCVFILSVLILIPNIRFETAWGKIYYTVALTDAYKQYNLLFSIPYKILSHYSALKAFFLMLIILLLLVVFLGMLMFMISLYFSNTCAIFIGELFAVSSLVSDNLSKKHTIVNYFFPSSWIRITNIGYNYNTNHPSVQYVLLILCSGIIILMVLSLYKIRKDGIY